MSVYLIYRMFICYDPYSNCASETNFSELSFSFTYAFTLMGKFCALYLYSQRVVVFPLLLVRIIWVGLFLASE